MNKYLKVFLALLLFVLFAVSARSAALTSQQIPLQPGWNAIWVEIEPTNNAPSAIFAGVNIDSVWGWSAQDTTVAYIDDPSQPIWNTSQMLMFVPTNRVDSFQNNLNSIGAGRAYFVKLLGGSAVTLNITGTPTTSFPNWTPDVFNLRGFPVDPFTPPTFQQFFSPSSAHFHNNALEQIYRLNGAGVWTLVGPAELMQRSMAYWVRCNGASDYVAPIAPKFSGGLTLDYDLLQASLDLPLVNNRPASSTATVTGLDVNGGAFTLVTSVATGLVYTPIVGNLTQGLGVGATVPMTIGVNRGLLPSDDFGGIVTISDGLGTFFKLPLLAKRITPGAGSDPLVQEAKRHAGLWVGYAMVNGVSEAHSGPLTTVLRTNQSGLVYEEKVRVGAGVIPTDVPQAFPLKLILHVDTNGVARMLKEVVQMFAEGTYTNAPDGSKALATPGRYVLVTEDSLIPQYTGSHVVDGKPAGRRVSTADFDFPADPAGNFLPLSGAFAVSNTISGTITLSSSFPTNPFRHKFHPDHDNLGPDFASASARPEVYEVTRAIEIMPTPTDPSGPTAPNYGDEVIAGTYKETVSGLHRVDIVTSGIFHLRRLSPVGVLNQ